ncbi:NADPH:quinone reductase-like Zn-dependent oxidoreductase [Actinopolyspora biskrensis]|uniref:NADPH:quinone reductase-like Zn-dependent oxidoreductase n=1 Tax=Actinopolyspora biskrensis TaxID=1470178 RepID=A0A852YXN4_9ACTN|nr:zinc-dependent alcohol dehydrogenase family protein [Actinopolyspora biskrensis]NYH77705.1 NADPH:quinone reductase-like Zn-dependent oxidoreductase [Actinopolyspora biskrensis]
MRAVVFHQHGAPEEVLETVSEVPAPLPGPGQVRVRLHARPVNPSDLLYVEGRYGRRAGQFPAAAGFEASGTVDSVGDGLSVATGTKVAVAVDGTWREYVLAGPEDLMRVPDHLPHTVACQATVNPATALLLTDMLALGPGKWLVHTAAASAVGRMVLSLAGRSGIRCVCVVRGGEHVDELLRLGADAVVDSSEEHIEEAVREHTGGGADAALDAVGGDVGTEVLKSLRGGGVFVSYGLLSGRPLRVEPSSLVFDDVRLTGFWLPLRLSGLAESERQRLNERAVELLCDPRCRPDVAERFDLAEVDRAVDRAGWGQPGGKIVLTG